MGRRGAGAGCIRLGVAEGTGRGARRIQEWERQDAYSAVLGCSYSGEGTSWRGKSRKRRRNRRRDKGEAVAPPQGRDRRNRSRTSWKKHRLSCNDKNISVSWETEPLM